MRASFSSMNLSFSRGDEAGRVRRIFRRIAESIGFSEKDLVFSTADSDTAKMTFAGWEEKTPRTEGWNGREVGYCDVDGLVTTEPG